MSKYKRMVTAKGKVNFFKDGKSIDALEVPLEVHAMLGGTEKTKTVTYQDAENQSAAPVEEDKGPVSFISGEPATRRKWLNGKVYWLTDEEYQTLNLGKLAQAVREKEQSQETVEATTK